MSFPSADASLPSSAEEGGRARCSGLLAFLVLRIQAATWRTTFDGLDAFDEALAARRPLLAVLWHGEYVPLFALLRNRRILVFTSRSRRGEVISDLCRRFGYPAVRIPDHGRERSLELMREALRGEAAGAVAVDGPLGPRHVVKRGAIVLASEQRRALYPISVASSRKRIVEGRWDRMEIPRLFSRVAVVVAAPLEVPPRIGPDGELLWQDVVRRALLAADRRAEELLRTAAPPPPEPIGESPTDVGPPPAPGGR